MGALGIRELIFVVAVVAFIMGARRLPDLARGLGSGIRNFRGSLKGGSEDAAPENTDGENVDGEVR